MKKKLFHIFSGYRIKDSRPGPEDTILFQKLDDSVEHGKLFLQKGLNLSDLSSKCCSNKTYLSQAIHKGGGSTFSGFINRKRIREAIAYGKEHPDTTVKELTDVAGFGTVVTFNKWFRKEMDTTPGRWLKELRRLAR